MVGPRGLYASVLVLLIGGAAIGSFTRDPDWTLPSEAKAPAKDAKAPANAVKPDAGRSPAATSATKADTGRNSAATPAAGPAATVQPVGPVSAGKVSTDTRDRTSRAGVDGVDTTGSIGSGASPVKPVSTNAAGLLGGAPAERTGTSRSIGNPVAAVTPTETPERATVDSPAVQAEDEPKPKAERPRTKAKQVKPRKPANKFAARKRSERTARVRTGPDGRAALMASDASVWSNPALPMSSCRLETRWAWTPAGDQPILVRVCR